MISNVHTHSVFCDGRDTPFEMAMRAFQLGFVSLGFSGHSDTGFDPCGMRDYNAYRAAVAAEKERWHGRMEIYCGIEQDYFSGRAEGWDYVIGSVHYVEHGGKKLAVDWSPEETDRIIREEYDGCAEAFAEDYYALVGNIFDVTGCDIIGHFDLITKFDEEGKIFSGARYRDAAMGAVEALTKTGAIFEVNTGALARGYRKTPYPAQWILRELRARGAEIIITSDCHNKDFLDFGYEKAVQSAWEAGFESALVLRGGKFERAGF